MLYSFATECRHSGTNPFSELSGHSNSVGILCARCRDADEGESWEAEISIEGREAVDPLVISFERASEG
jgi:hypothetical protein